MSIRTILLLCIFTVMLLFVLASGWLSARGMARLEQELSHGVQMELLSEGAAEFVSSALQFCAVYENLPEGMRTGDPARDLEPYMVDDNATHYLLFDGAGAPLGGKPLEGALLPLADPAVLAAFFDEAKNGSASELTADNYADFAAGKVPTPAILHLRAYPERNLLLGLGRSQEATGIRFEALASNAAAAREKLLRREAGLQFCLALLTLTLVWLILQHLFFLPLARTMEAGGAQASGGALTWSRFKDYASRIRALADDKKQLRDKLEHEVEARFQAEEDRDLLRNTMERFRITCRSEIEAESARQIRDWQASLMRREARVLHRHFRAPLETLLHQLPDGPAAEPLRGTLSRCISIAQALGGEGGPLPYFPQDVSLQPWLEDVTAKFAESHGIRVTTNICNGTLLHLDPESLRNAIEFVMDNAAMASPEGAAISVDAVKIQDGVEIRIVDHGPGIGTDTRPHVAVPFFTLDEQSDGLGLAVTKTVIEQHGGTISLQSESEKGTVVIIRLPVAHPEN